jgi:cold shock CspA family protein/ribosome-associated translation inhibitor RaiA
METPVQIDFHGMETSDMVRALVDRHIEQLEERTGRITACRVSVRGPGERHRTGGLYQINIWISLPDGREVSVGHTPQNDERHSDINYAINDAFKRARRQLQDEVRVMGGDVKHHAEDVIGTVSMIDKEKEFGFLKAPDGQEIYFHKNSVLDDAFGRLEPGSHVTYVEEAGEKGTQASTVRLVSRHTQRT